MNKKKKLIIVCILSLLISVFLLILFFLVSKNNSSDTNYTDVLLKENVVIITDETEKEQIPHSVTENTLSFTKNPKYDIGTIIVSGITEESPAGYIRRVIKIDNKDSEIVVTTEPATFLDVFEKLHFSKIIELSENENNENSTELMMNTLNISPNLLLKVNTMPVTNTKNNNTENGERKNLFQVEFDEKTDNFIQVKGSAEAKIWLELKIDIENDNIELSLTANDEVNGIVFVGYQTSYDKNYEKEIFSKQLPNIQIMAGPVPIVITNDITAKLECEADISGEIGTTLEIKETSKNGFIYSSKDTTIEEINEKEFTSGGVECTTGATAKGSVKAGVGIYLTTLFYDCSGAEMVLGVEGKTAGEITVDANTLNTDDKYYGKLLLSISPNIAGNIIVQIPVIDDDLYEMEIFKVELKPFWEKVWENSIKSSESVYFTKWSEQHKVTAPVFQFVIPSGWTVSEEELDNGLLQEKVVITNGKGLEITYLSYASKQLGGAGRNWFKANVTRLCNSSFVPGYVQATDYSSLGKFVVAKIHVEKWMHADMHTNFQNINTYYYAVVPEALLGEQEYAQYLDEFSFNYPTHYSFIASSSNGQFTKDEEKEIQEILSSFKEVKGLY